MQCGACGAVVDESNVFPGGTVRCACGNTWKTRSTRSELRLEICSNCHPFFTGKSKLVDTAGRVERFQKRYANAPKAVAKGKASATPA